MPGLSPYQGRGSATWYQPTERLTGGKPEKDSLPDTLSSKSETIRQNYLHPLLAQQRLVMTLPDTPDSPLQACRSVGEA